MAIYTLINGFNLYEPGLKYKDLVFSLSFFIYNGSSGGYGYSDVKYVTAGIKKWGPADKQFAPLAAYLFQTGVIRENAIYLPHSSLDFVLENLRNIGPVCYLRPDRRVRFSEERRAPVIRVLPVRTGRGDKGAGPGGDRVGAGGETGSAESAEEEKAFIEVEEGFEIIQGRITSYALYDDTIYYLHKDFPISFYRLINGKSTVLAARLIPEHLANGYTPGVAPALKTKQKTPGEKVRQVHVRPKVTITVGRQGPKGDVYIKPVIHYGKYLEVVAGGEYRPGDHYPVTVDGILYRVDRDEVREILLRNVFKRHSYYFDFKEDRYIGSREDSARVLAEQLLPELGKENEIVFLDGLENLAFTKSKISIKINSRYNSGNGLFDFDLEFHCKELELTLDDLAGLVEQGRKYLLNSNTYIEVENRGEIGRLLTAVRDNMDGKLSGSTGRFAFSLSPLKTIVLGQTLAKCEGVAWTADAGHRRFMEAATERGAEDEMRVDAGLIPVLRNYQVKGVQWLGFLVKYGLAGILADDMGLGKTLQALALLRSMRGSGPSLVVCPKTLVWNWYAEIRKFTPELKTLIPEGNAQQRKAQIAAAGEYDLVITSYPLLRNDLESYLGFRFRCCILDEAQNIKNPDAECTRSVKAIKAEYRLALTGTPMENSLLELWSVFDFLLPGFLGNRRAFNEKYGDAPEKLRERVKPFILRRTKAETLTELPPKIEQVLYATMEEKQLGLYLSVLDFVRKSVVETVERDGFGRSRIHILAALTKLRQICNHPRLLCMGHSSGLEQPPAPDCGEDSAEGNPSAKLELFMEILEENLESGHKVLVFSQFARMLRILADTLKEEDIGFAYLDGQSQNRGDIIRTFNADDGPRVFLISLKAGGYGLNLTAADTVVLFDPWWNPMAENQAVDRAYRMGQQRTVNVYRLITRGTVEEKIQALQQKKRALFDSVIDSNEGFIEKLGWEDIRQLLE